MTFIGFHTEIAPDEGCKKCPEFWDKEYAAKYARRWQTMKPETAVEAAILENGIGMYAICTENEKGFAYWIAGLYKGGGVPAGLELSTFPESDWVIFTAAGSIPCRRFSICNKFVRPLDKHNTSCYDVLHEGRHSMDIQLKRGLLDVCVLAAIRSEDSYGYKIIKDMKPYIELSESTLYTILKRLETSKMLTVRTAEHDGRLRKYYHITDEGLKRIDEFRNDWQEILSIYRFVTKEDDGDE